MSRRESRNSFDARNNDTLFEFESFKKKFLLANKHITKLNSTLSVRIEELNAQISMLYTENLRLRASEIALAAELKREREKSRQIVKQTEAAALYLTKHLTSLRQGFNICDQAPRSPSPTPPPKATRRPISQNNTSPTLPVAPRLARAPTIPKIHEDDEPSHSSQDEDPLPPSPRRKAKAKARLSASRLPLPSRIASPPPQEIPTSHVALQIDFTSIPPPPASKKKTSRRQSGLLIDTRMSTLENEAPPSSLTIPRPASPAFGSPIRRATGLAEEREEAAALRGIGDDAVLDEDVVPVKKTKTKSRDKDTAIEASAARTAEKKKLKNRAEGEGVLTDGGLGTGSGIGKKLKLQDVTNSPYNGPIASPVDAAAMSEIEAALAPSTSSSSRSSSHLPTPSPPPDEGEGESTAAGGRERRVRKSVNYAEPKLNTKMRKPDPPEGSTAPTTSRKRSSSSSSKPRSRGSDQGDEEAGGTENPRSSLEREEAPPLRSYAVADPGDDLVPPPSSSMPVKRKKSRPCITHEDDEDDLDDGADADEEYVSSYGAGRASWVNVSERRKGVRDRRATGGTAGKGRTDDERRHSLAV
ncbi:hypothetical protein VNI00_009791 [Paramarasmius palmivorus]|uniref:Shugoshin C-terminal domain-containing protein n=1 Tax=Paramarasmius palmivorus TaxID=297713 RepID=A0AAW0CNE7_9AGAR